MTAEEYKAVMDQVTMIATVVEEWDLEAAFMLADSALSIGHIVDPTSYRERGAQNVEDAQALLAPLVAFQHAARRIKKREATRTEEIGGGRR